MERKLFVLVVAVLTSYAVRATVVDRQQAAQQAREFMAKNFKSSTRHAAQTAKLNSVETGQPLVYAFNVEGGGFVVVAGDDSAPAILGYSETSAIDPADIPDGMKDLFAQYQQEMQVMSRAGTRAETVANLGPEIPHLMKSEWGQAAPYFNMCPRHYYADGDGAGRSLTGCVATAMAQIMYYHKYPAEIKELPGQYYNQKKKCTYKALNVSKTLEWDKMLPTYGTRKKVVGTQEQQNAVAKLMRLVGQSVCMKYTPECSNANSATVLSSFVNFFNYDASTIKYVERYRYSYGDWIKMIYKELSEKRPVYYAGASNTGGHAYVVDGYKNEDFFCINWGWYGSGAESVFRLSLCNPGDKYEGGGSGDAGYTGIQDAVIGLQPAKTPQQMAPVFDAFFRWGGKYTYERASADDNFDLTQCIYQNLFNFTHFANPVLDYGVVVKNAKGEAVQTLLPLNSDTEKKTVKPGYGYFFFKYPLKVGAGLGDGDYRLQFLHRIDGGEWIAPLPVREAAFKIKGNKLYFDCRPDWLTVKMNVEEKKDDKQTYYKVTVTLENKSSDQTFHRTIRLGRDDAKFKDIQYYGFTVTLGPGETKTVDMDYKPGRIVNPQLYLMTYEDCVPLGEGVATGASSWQSITKDWQGSFNLTSQLVKLADDTYVLKADDHYDVSYTFKNTGTTDMKGYIELVDSVSSVQGLLDPEENDSNGELISLKPGESKELKLTIYNDGDDDLMHKICVLSYDSDEQSTLIDATPTFTIRPVHDLSLTGLTVTPIEETDDEYGIAIVEGNQMTVSAKISNPETTDFEGSIVLKRYITDFSKEYEADENGYYYLEPDKTYEKKVTIPAGGSIDYSELLDLKELTQDNDYTVAVEFGIFSVSKAATGEVILLFSDAYLLNDGTPTAIQTVPAALRKSSAVYDLRGRRVSGEPRKGIYIIDGKKKVLK